MNKNEPSLPEESLFLQVLEIGSADDRAAFLNRACGSDAELRRGVEALLRHHREGSSFLEAPPTEVVVAAAQLTTSEPDTAALDFLSPSNDPLSLGRLGYYEVLEVLGHGGFGVVLKARDTKLDRIVAVKTLALSLASSATARKRFVREAKAAAAVKHENVVGIYHVADDGPVPYLVMECVSGVSLEAKLQQVGTLDSPAILRIGMQIASGLAAAHQKGLVHRDVKPGNILLENGVERVKITDFGLARAADDVAITKTGEVAGTPQYMSPEQAQGLPLDARSDLFSLASVLYAMAAGRSPFRAESTVAALRRVCDDTPRPIREINSDIPDWLEEIIGRLLAKQPSERFQTATEVADLLGRYLAHVQQSAIVPSPKPAIASRPPSTVGSRWWSVALITLVAITCIMGLTEASGVTKVVPTVIRIVRGEGTLVIEVDDPTVQVALDGEALSIRGAGLQELKLVPGKYRLHATKDGQPVKDEVVTISRDGRKVVTVTREGSGGSGSPGVAPAAEQPVGELTLLAKLGGHTDVVRAVAFLPDGRRMVSVSNNKLADGRRMVSVSYDNSARIWDLPTRTVLATLPAECYLEKADVSADGRLIAVLLRDGSKAVAQVWDIENREVVCHFAPELNQHNCIRFTPDGTRLVTSVLTSSVPQPYGVLWDAATGGELGRFDMGDTNGVHEATFSPDGRLLALGAKGRVRLFDIESRNVVADVPLPNPWNVWDLEFAPSGKTLATGQGGGHVSLIEVGSWRVIKTLQGSGANRCSLRFLGGDRFLLTSSGDATLRVWDLEQGKVLARAATENGPNHGLFVSPDGRQVITAGGKEWDDASKSMKDYGDYALRLWQLPEGVWPAASRPTSLPADTTNQTPKAEAGAFVLLGSNGVAERKFDTLAEAVQFASDGDTIEVRGNGPFVTDPVSIRKSINIRAAAGFRPQLQMASSRDGKPLLNSVAIWLTLEGLEFVYVHREPVSPEKQIEVVQAAGDELQVVNCRFVRDVEAQGPCLRVRAAKRAEIRNSEFIRLRMGNGIAYHCPGQGTLLVENCVDAGYRLFLQLVADFKSRGRSSILLWRNTSAAKYTVQIFTDNLLQTLPPADALLEPRLSVECVRNVFQSREDLLIFGPSKQRRPDLTPEKLAAHCRASCFWQEEGSLYSNAGFLGVIDEAMNLTRPQRVAASLEDWNRFWGHDSSTALEGAPVFHGGDIYGIAQLGNATLASQDFRLRPDSPGYRAGPDGKDLGADIDLVGPGAAYERWKRTPEYQEWLKETGQEK